MTDSIDDIAVTSRARKYIASVRWQFAKTYAEKAPHEYTVRKWNPQLQDEFDWFMQIVRGKKHTKPELFGRHTYWYFYLDGYRYWSFGFPLILINRCPEDQVRDYQDSK